MGWVRRQATPTGFRYDAGRDWYVCEDCGSVVGDIPGTATHSEWHSGLARPHCGENVEFISAEGTL